MLTWLASSLNISFAARTASGIRIYHSHCTLYPMTSSQLSLALGGNASAPSLHSSQPQHHAAPDSQLVDQWLYVTSSSQSVDPTGDQWRPPSPPFHPSQSQHENAGSQSVDPTGDQWRPPNPPSLHPSQLQYASTDSQSVDPTGDQWRPPSSPPFHPSQSQYANAGSQPAHPTVGQWQLPGPPLQFVPAEAQRRAPDYSQGQVPASQFDHEASYFHLPSRNAINLTSPFLTGRERLTGRFQPRILTEKEEG
jgi:hypothetical protein